MTEVIQTGDSLPSNSLSEAAVDALRLELSMLSPADEARERHWVRSANARLAINFGRFMGEPPFDEEAVAERFIFTTQEHMNALETAWADYDQGQEAYLSPERSAGGAFFDVSIGNIAICVLPDCWDLLDAEVQQSFLDEVGGDEQRAQASAHRSVLFAEEVHELSHTYQDGSLPLAFLECGAYYYTEAIQSQRGGCYLYEPEDRERAAFYASLLAEFGDEVHRVFFGTSGDETTKQAILDAFTVETVQRLFPDLRTLAAASPSSDETLLVHAGGDQVVEERAELPTDTVEVACHSGAEAAIEDVRGHSFSYGLETAVSQPSSYIQLVNGEFQLSFTSANSEDATWYGDCAADVLLVAKALSGVLPADELHTEYVVYEAPEVGFGGTHYRTRARGVSLDHSGFYSSLPSDYATEVQVARPNPEEPLIGTIGVGNLKNYKEFEDGDKRYLVVFMMRESAGELLTSVRVLEQGEDGRLIRGIESSYLIDQGILTSQGVAGADLERTLHFSEAYATQRSEGGFQPFVRGKVRDETIACFTNVINAYTRGLVNR